jgi:hypothetical protein
MKLYQAMLPLAAAMMIAGCGNRGTAQSVVGQADAAIRALKEEAAFTAPAELKTAEATLAHMKQGFDQRDYQVVVNDVPQFNAQLDTLKAAVASKRTATAAAREEWTTLSVAVATTVEAIQARVDSLEPGALPKSITPEEFETVKTELETLKTTWAEAGAAASVGNTAEATEKGHIVQAKAEALKSSLGMTETLASAG